MLPVIRTRIYQRCLQSPSNPVIKCVWINRILVRRYSSPLEAAAADVPIKPTPANAPITHKQVGYWLLGSAGLVFGIVVVGGLTRLTESGLSITEWNPVTGVLPPLTQDAWIEEFQKYKRHPEYKLLNQNISLDEFKFIFFMEWAHRIWGRVIGLSFILPMTYFIARKKVTPRIRNRLLGIAGLIGFQGFIGWWMVRSGLGEDLKDQSGVPRVSQYRLATHLGLAFTVYLLMLHTGLSILNEHRFSASHAYRDAIIALKLPALRNFKIAVGLTGAMVFLTALSGAFVAGLDAGMIYNTFPLMGESLFPPKSELISPNYARSSSDITWRNMLENPVTAQLDHRVLAISTFAAIVALWAYSRRLPLPRPVLKATGGVLHVALLQVALGISTLLYVVPIPLAAAHQAGSLALLTMFVVLGSRLRVPRTLMASGISRSKIHRSSLLIAGVGIHANKTT
ncbi:Cytochrome c oxidase assembly protein COX15 [Neolecta irregularis DAH-3]|uniref:Cytochrome c oxidase assembly protein COX15 n=1 Tax=Neolecta irregularis (strain DAH-3) TaxID=1198029 RepID=A0A1U7LW83_NEOID|nr:Cytochrome c oxidase assembly protein COX15 [Neolecta irregularis DAH-3]|eukprot:OLL26894.1 Cytochrome c oxidase assembly protein COX15 [Neolecta irregularis DAH-3]